MENALAIFLYLLFWVVVVSVGEYLLTSLGAMLFPVSTQWWRQIREEIILSRDKEISSQNSLTEETEEEQYRNAA